MAESIRILYVDDNPGDRALVRHSLEKVHGGFEVTEAKSKIEFEKIINEQVFDLVLTDFNIMGFEGMQVLETVKSISPNIPVIIVTGTGSEEVAIQAIRNGAKDYVIKTIQHINRLPKTIISALEDKRIRDEKEKAFKELAKMNRVYAVISQINQLIVKANDRDKLFRECCEIAIKYGKFRLAWIGLTDEKSKIVQPFCWAGFEDEYLSKFKLIRIDDSPEGRGPVGSAIRDGRYFVCKDTENDPAFEPWRKEAVTRGYRSLIALPIRLNNNVIGSYNLYSDEINFFDNQEIELLKEIVNDISFAINTMLINEKRINAEQLIKKSEDRYRDLFENSNDLICLHDLDGNLLIVNDSATRITGYSKSELLKMNMRDLLVPQHRQSFSEYLKKVKTTGRADGIMSILTKSGERRYWMYNNTLRSEGVAKPVIRGIVKDITEQKISELELRTKKDDLQKFFDEDISGNFESTVQGQIIKCNKTFLKIYGFSSEEEALTFQLGNLYRTPSDRSKFIEIIKKNKKVENYENEFITVDGRRIYVVENVSGIFNDSGDLIQLRGYIVDITERKLAEEEIRKLYRGIQQSPTSIIITDKNGNIEYVNTKVTEITGYKLEEIIGSNPRMFSSGEKPQSEYKLLWETILSSKEWHGEFHNKKKSGELFWESASISPILNNKNEVTHFIAIKEDITERKIILKELVEAKEKAEEMNRVKSSFFANMSHELRTPLIGILGFSDLLKDELAGSELYNMVETINISGNRLLNTLNLILQISKIDSGKININFEIFNVIEIIKEVINLWKITADKNKIYLNLDTTSESIVINSDRQLLYEIMNNLVSNAIKFTERGGIKIKLHKIIEGKDSWIIIQVIDTGIGISNENQEVIFNEFRQASEGYSRTFEGTGLGLTISKRLTEALGGTISVESELRKGTTFQIKLPANYSSSTLESVETDKLNASAKKIINHQDSQNKSLIQELLLVEDDPVSTYLIRLLLKNYYVIDSCTNADEAVQMVNQKIYSAILMDISLGTGKNGLDATREIKKLKEYAEIPIIALTAYAMSGDKERFLESGCTHYLSKPFIKNDLLEILREALA
ncbi:MAG: PAS domain S-box protein [Ignavibacteriaceae bacterium]